MEYEIIRVPYAVICALNNLRLGICRAYYMDWAMATPSLKRSTASTYWQRARQLRQKELMNPNGILVYSNY